MGVVLSFHSTMLFYVMYTQFLEYILEIVLKHFFLLHDLVTDFTMYGMQFLLHRDTWHLQYLGIQK
jgi:hypothetical protein